MLEDDEVCCDDHCAGLSGFATVTHRTVEPSVDPSLSGLL